MIYDPYQSASDYFHHGIPFIMEGQVVHTADPDQMGRVKVWIPALDGENLDIDNLPWANYASPFFGFTVEYPNGGTPVDNPSHSAYGMWAIPKVGATVAVFFLNANPGSRYYFASTLRLHRNRSLPNGRNFDIDGEPGPWGDAGDGEGKYEPIQPAYDNLRQQFQDQVESSQAVTRGAYERQVAQGQNEKDGKEGYSDNAADPTYLDPQTYCWITPGRHGIIMQDDPKRARLRVKTAEGHQVIFDDANERIYISTAKGKSWIEMDLDGHVHIFSAQSISMRSGVDINLFADNNINLEANKEIHMKANNGDIRMSTAKTLHLISKEKTLVSACDNLEMSSENKVKIQSVDNMELKSKAFLSTSAEGTDIHARSIKITSLMGTDLLAGTTTKITAGIGINLLAGAYIKETASVIHLNGPTASFAMPASRASDAACPELAKAPSIVPGHEPWVRPPSPNERGPNWKA